MQQQFMNQSDEKWITRLKVINLDKERDHGISIGRDFIISEPQSLKKEFKSDSSIFSSKFGDSVYDINAFMDRYRCNCGHLTGTLYNHEICPNCKSEVKFVDNDFKRYGWIVLKDYYLIHPSLFRNVQSLIGAKNLKEILEYKDEKDENGFEIEIDRSEFKGIGMIEFVSRIDEILKYFYEKSTTPAKKMHYEHIINNREHLLTKSIPVYTLFLRKAAVNGNVFTFKGDNALYQNMARYAQILNTEAKMAIGGQYKTKANSLYAMQENFNDLTHSVIEALSGKKGMTRDLLGGRYNFSGRAVITPDSSLRIDEIKLPYHMLVVLNEQIIINILCRTFSLEYSKAYKKWWKAQLEIDKDVLSILEYLIKSRPRGMSYIINRNPSINLGSLLHMYCVGIVTDSYTLKVPLQVLQVLAADFDGDCINVLNFINKEFESRCAAAFNPRNSFMVSHENGKFDSTMNIFKDELVNLNSLVYLTRHAYSDKEFAKINELILEDDNNE